MAQLFKNAACFTDIHYGLKQNSRVHLDDCHRFADWFIEEAKAKARVEGVFESEGDILNGLPKLVDQLLAQLAGDLPPVAAPVSQRRQLMTRVGTGVSLVGALGIAYGFYAAKQAEDALPSADKVMPADAQNFEAALGAADLAAVVGWSLLGAGVAVRFIP